MKKKGIEPTVNPVSRKPEVSPSPDDELEILRKLILNTEQSKIAEVEERLYNPVRHAEEISQVIAEAILIRASRDKSLAHALQPTLEEAIKTSVRNDPKFLVDALFPIMGPAIRKAIAESLRSMMQSLNQSLKYAFSWEGLKWRLESIRTGKPFAEIVLLHTLVYSVDQVFLIHKDTGLLLAHVSRGDAQVKDADLISPMLTAIQDFTRDSFNTGDGQALQTLNVGELTVWIEQGSQTVLAETVTGEAPLELRTAMAEVLEKIESEYNEMLHYYNGDNSAFKLVIPALETCLKAVTTRGEKPMGTSPDKPFNPAVLIFWVTLICLALIVFGYLASK